MRVLLTLITARFIFYIGGVWCMREVGGWSMECVKGALFGGDLDLDSFHFW